MLRLNESFYLGILLSIDFTESASVQVTSQQQSTERHKRASSLSKSKPSLALVRTKKKSSVRHPDEKLQLQTRLKQTKAAKRKSATAEKNVCDAGTNETGSEKKETPAVAPAPEESIESVAASVTTSVVKAAVSIVEESMSDTDFIRSILDDVIRCATAVPDDVMEKCPLETNAETSAGKDLEPESSKDLVRVGPNDESVYEAVEKNRGDFIGIEVEGGAPEVNRVEVEAKERKADQLKRNENVTEAQDTSQEVIDAYDDDTDVETEAEEGKLRKRRREEGREEREEEESEEVKDGEEKEVVKDDKIADRDEDSATTTHDVTPPMPKRSRRKSSLEASDKIEPVLSPGKTTCFRSSIFL